MYGLGSGAIPDLYAFLDEQNVLVYRAALGSISGPRRWRLGDLYNHPELGYCLLVNSDTTPGRQAFTLAHEFAHALFHYPSRGLISWKGVRDPQGEVRRRFRGPLLGSRAKQLKDLVEDERRSGWPDPYEALQLASYFRVSYATLLYRLSEEKMIRRRHLPVVARVQPEPMAFYLGMDPEEFSIPEHKTLHLERYPVSVIERVKRAVDEGALTPSQAAGLLRRRRIHPAATHQDVFRPAEGRR